MFTAATKTTESARYPKTYFQTPQTANKTISKRVKKVAQSVIKTPKAIFRPSFYNTKNIPKDSKQTNNNFEAQSSRQENQPRLLQNHTNSTHIAEVSKQALGPKYQNEIDVDDVDVDEFIMREAQANYTNTVDVDTVDVDVDAVDVDTVDVDTVDVDTVDINEFTEQVSKPKYEEMVDVDNLAAPPAGPVKHNVTFASTPDKISVIDNESDIKKKLSYNRNDKSAAKAEYRREVEKSRKKQGKHIYINRQTYKNTVKNAHSVQQLSKTATRKPNWFLRAIGLKP